MVKLPLKTAILIPVLSTFRRFFGFFGSFAERFPSLSRQWGNEPLHGSFQLSPPDRAKSGTNWLFKTAGRYSVAPTDHMTGLDYCVAAPLILDVIDASADGLWAVLPAILIISADIFAHPAGALLSHVGACDVLESEGYW